MNNFLEKLKKRSKTDFVILILLGVLVMIIAVPTGSKTSASKEPEQEATEILAKVQPMEDYRENMEEQLSDLIERMSGAGKAQVMITFSDEGNIYVDKNTSTDENKTEETTVVYDSGDGEEPYVIRQEQPKVEGVVVVAEGGGNPVVATQIKDAVMSLFDIEAHKVIVVKMSVQEE